MADFRLVRATSSVTRGTDDDQWMALRGTRDGAAFTADWVLAHCIEGRVFVANAGTATAPITFGAGSIDTAEFDLHVAVPSGTTVIPIALDIQIEAFGSNAIFECLAVSGSGSTTGAGTSVTPKNVRSDAPNSSNCTVTSAATVTSGVAIATNVCEFFRDGHIVAQTPVTALLSESSLQTHFSWSLFTKGYAPVVVGASQIGVFAAAQASTGFITLVWVEVPSTAIV